MRTWPRLAFLALTTTAVACAPGKPTDTAGEGTPQDTGCGCPEPVTFYADLDADGYGDPEAPVQACTVPSGYVGNAADCDDTRGDVNPDASEVCDGIDDDCNGVVDDGATDDATWYADADGDGFGDPSTSTTACSQPSGYVADATDCDDGNAASYPGALELCDGVQNTCDSGWTTDDGIATWFDNDGSVTDLTAIFAAGINGAPTAWSSTNSGLLQICAGTWYLNLALSGDDVQVAGMEATVVDGGQVGRPLNLAATTSADIHDLTIRNGLVGGSGGGVQVSGGGTFSAQRIEVSNCSAGNDGGGLQVVDAASVSLDTVTLSSNQAGGNGGGMRVETSGSLAVTDSSFTGNVAGSSGGGVGLDTTPANFDNVVFDANQAGGTGGGLVADGATATVAHATVTSNTAQSGGGMTCGPTAASALDLSDIVFEGNDASSLGGAIYARENGADACGSVTGTDMEITGQSIDGYGAAMADFGSGSTYERVNIHDNASREVLYLRGGEKTFSDSIISNNSTSEALVYTDTSTTIDLVNTEVSNNAAGNWGLFVIQSASALTCTGDTSIDTYGIWGNSAGWTGIVVVGTDSTFEAADCDMGDGSTTANNSATDVYLSGSGQRYDYGNDATFTCSDSTGSCL